MHKMIKSAYYHDVTCTFLLHVATMQLINGGPVLAIHTESKDIVKLFPAFSLNTGTHWFHSIYPNVMFVSKLIFVFKLITYKTC